MTRRQAEALVKKIVAAATREGAARKDVRWTTIEVTAEQCGLDPATDVGELMKDSGGIISAVLPMGWRIGARDGSKFALRR